MSGNRVRRRLGWTSRVWGHHGFRWFDAHGQIVQRAPWEAR